MSQALWRSRLTRLGTTLLCDEVSVDSELCRSTPPRLRTNIVVACLFVFVFADLLNLAAEAAEYPSFMLLLWLPQSKGVAINNIGSAGTTRVGYRYPMQAVGIVDPLTLLI